MNQYAAAIVTLTAAMACFMVMRIYGDWLRIATASEEGLSADLESLRQSLCRWQLRHLTGAGLSVFLLAGICFLPVFSTCAGFSGAVMVYAAVSCCLAGTETLLMQRLTSVKVGSAVRR
jgi:hypothetical protein